MRYLPDPITTLTVLPRTHPATAHGKVLDDPHAKRPIRSRHLPPEQREWIARNLPADRPDLVCLITRNRPPAIIGWKAQTTY